MIELRTWTPGDARRLTEIAATTPDLERQTGGASLATVADAETFIEQALGASNATNRPFAIALDGVVAGTVGLSAIEHRHGTAWTWYWLAADARGNGLATVGLATVAVWAFRELDLHRLELGHRVNNPASCGVAGRAGFLVEGIEREKLRYGSERFDVETHARLRSDPAPTMELVPMRG